MLYPFTRPKISLTGIPSRVDDDEDSYSIERPFHVAICSQELGYLNYDISHRYFKTLEEAIHFIRTDESGDANGYSLWVLGCPIEDY